MEAVLTVDRPPRSLKLSEPRKIKPAMLVLRPIARSR